MTTKSRLDRKQEIQQSTKILLEGLVDISRIESLYGKLEDSLKTSSDNVVLDAEKIDHIDAAALQLLSSYCRSAAAQGIVIKWRRPSEAVVQAAKLLGLLHVLSISE